MLPVFKGSQQACSHEVMIPLFFLRARKFRSVRSLLGFHCRSIENVFVCFPLVSFVIAFESFALFPFHVCLLFLLNVSFSLVLFIPPHLYLFLDKKMGREIKIKHTKKMGD